MSLDETRIAFVGCSPRSGSTLLIRLLDSHTRIAAPCELAIPVYFRGDREKEQLVNRKYQQICAYYGVDLARAMANPRGLLDAILRREQKEFIVLKDPRQSLFFRQIRSDFPGACFIFLVRDVRSVAMSSMFRAHPAAGFQRWYEYNSAILEALRNRDHVRVHTIRYEDLVETPEESLERLAGFLGYEFEPAMLNYGDFHHADDDMRLWEGSPKSSPLHVSLQHGAISRKVYEGRNRFSDAVMRLYETHDRVRGLNESFGY